MTYTDRKTYATVGDRAQLIVKEKILTDAEEVGRDRLSRCVLAGRDSRADIVSRSVARGKVRDRKFRSDLIGKNACFGHVECDGILLEGARIVSVAAASTRSTRRPVSCMRLRSVRSLGSS